jgi:hypothetical protein
VAEAAVAEAAAEKAEAAEASGDLCFLEDLGEDLGEGVFDFCFLDLALLFLGGAGGFIGGGTGGGTGGFSNCNPCNRLDLRVLIILILENIPLCPRPFERPGNKDGR